MARSDALICAIAGCENAIVVKSRGWCDKHYTRWKRHGDPEHVTQIDTRGLDVEGKLRAHGWDVTESGCWEWRGRKSGQRYGKLNIGQRHLLAHRLAYELWVGPIPGGLVVRHKCDNPPCINPEHLEAGTHADNSNDMVERRRTQDQRGANGPRAVLTDEDVSVIRVRYANGAIRQIDLAQEYGVTQTCISAIVRNKTWNY